MMQGNNNMKVSFDARSVNEAFARVTVAAFIAELNPTVDEVEDVKTAVSEAVTNAIIHAYDDPKEQVQLACSLKGNVVEIVIADTGKGIGDIKKAMEPFYTTKPELERSGMGFAFMEAFMDTVRVESVEGEGTRVWMCKKIGAQEG